MKRSSPHQKLIKRRVLGKEDRCRTHNQRFYDVTQQEEDKHFFIYIDITLTMQNLTFYSNLVFLYVLKCAAILMSVVDL